MMAMVRKVAIKAWRGNHESGLRRSCCTEGTYYEVVFGNAYLI